jgi:luciferase-like monooxygenase
MNRQLLLTMVEREVLGWPGVSAEPGRFGATSFRYGKREIGHIHHDLIADLPVTSEMREDILARGRARAHRAGVKGYISYPLEDQEDVSVVLEILGANYDRAQHAAERRAASRQAPQE